MEQVRYAEADRVALLTLDRPAVHNAISLASMTELEAILDRLAHRLDIGAVVLTGSGDRTFTSGGDLKEFDALRSRAQAVELWLRMQLIMRRFRELEVPVIAALNGDAYGGGFEVALGCDIRVASRAARFGFLQVTLGITPAWGGRDRMVEAIGRSQALLFMLTGDVVSAEEAARLGLVDRVVEPSDVHESALAIARRIAGHAPQAIRAIKRAVNRAAQLDADAAMRFEAENFAETWLSDDHWEVLAARREKRPPVYVGG